MRTFLASKIHFEVLGLGLEAYNSSRMTCPRLEDSIFFDLLKIGHGHDLFSHYLGKQQNPRGKFAKTFFCFLRSPGKKILGIFFENTCPLCPLSSALASRILVLGLEHSCPWSRKGLSSRSRSLVLDFFCVVGLEGCVLDSASG